MKFLFALVALAATALVTDAFPSGNSVPVTGERLKELQRRHAEVEHKRQAESLIAMAVGVWLYIAGESAGETFIGAIANALTAAFGGDKAPWENKKNCLAKFTTQGGGRCMVSTTAASKSGNSTSDANKHDDGTWNVCAWIDPDHTTPGIQYWTDPGIGDYSVQFTATGGKAYDGIKKTSKCVAAGLCNPRFTFYRDGYTIILDTWRSEGDISDGQYKGDFHGLCGNGPVKDQFHKNGAVLGYDCAIPCWNDADLPSTKG